MAAAWRTRRIQWQLDINSVVCRQLAQLRLIVGADHVIRRAHQVFHFRGGGVRFTRNSLGMSAGSVMAAACGVATLCFGAACGAGAAAPTPTVVPATAVSAVPAPSPQRPPLASPVASPAPAITAAAPTAAPSADTTAGDTYEVQSGDTLRSEEH